MRKLILLLAIVLISLTVIGQTKPTDKVLRDTVIRSVQYKIYQGARGGKYYFKVSKSGTTYKVYLKK